MDRIIRGILFILIIGLFVVYNNGMGNSQLTNNAYALLSGNGKVENNSVYYEKNTLTEDNNNYTNVISFTNTYSYPITLSKENIKVNCTGSGKNKSHDEALVKQGFKINAKFANEKNGSKKDTVTVEKRGTAYIFVSGSYEGTYYPENEVSCDYSISIMTA